MDLFCNFCTPILGNHHIYPYMLSESQRNLKKDKEAINRGILILHGLTVNSGVSTPDESQVATKPESTTCSKMSFKAWSANTGSSSEDTSDGWLPHRLVGHLNVSPYDTPYVRT